MKKRRWPIGAKFIALLLTPIISLVTLWVFATSMALDSARNLLAAQTNYDKVSKPAGALVTELQNERRLSLVLLGTPASEPKALTWQRANTDTVVTAFRRHTASEDLREVETPATRARIDETLQGLDQLLTIRQTIDQRQIDRTAAFRMYTSIIDSGFHLTLALPNIAESDITRDSRTIITLSRAREILSQEDAYLSGIASAGRFNGSEPGQVAALIGAHRFLLDDSIVELPDRDRQAFEEVLAGEAVTRLRALEDKLLTEARPGAPLPIDITTWQSTYDTVSSQLHALEYQAGQAILSRSRPVGVSIMVRLGLAGVLGLLAIVASIVVSIRIWRSLIRRLTTLELTAHRLAVERLPSVVLRLRQGQHVDVTVEAPPLDFGVDEIGQVGQAFSAVQRTAIESAINEAQLRSGINKVFLNIARRSQTLLHRQLSLLDGMERRTIDPAKLQELFQLDHLATRMRRHAEDLVILAGSAPARGWRTPVALIDVLRGAISEVEEYARITLQMVPEIALAGPVVADITHLLSELLENASAFSPPDTSVIVSGQVVPHGLAIDIEDRGLGMPAEAINDANERLAHPPEFDPANSARLGLFVVATLAARHNVIVNLRRSPYGGITAVVLLSPDLLVDTPQQQALPPGQPTDATVELTRIDGLAGPRPTAPDNGRGPAAETTHLGWGCLDLARRPADPPTPPAVVEGAVVSSAPAVEVPRRPATTAADDPECAAVVLPGPPSTTIGDGPVGVSEAVWQRPEPTELTPEPAELTSDGLPLRRRQTHLAPQLRDDAPAPGRPVIPVPGAAAQVFPGGNRPASQDLPSPRSPEETRAMMSALQAGTQRGRQHAIDLAQTAHAGLAPEPQPAADDDVSEAAPVPDEHERRQA
ncbi:MAG: hypothetical protein HKP61_14775 [Dactylosporangium sp.]|nr:nitrate- and nitrite sensing domain-containing protein [Dactylosporangium sp.]NNJ62175.1 hypothetical protein [Dactylosporangium sp.]